MIRAKRKLKRQKQNIIAMTKFLNVMFSLSSKNSFKRQRDGGLRDEDGEIIRERNFRKSFFQIDNIVCQILNQSHTIIATDDIT